MRRMAACLSSLVSLSLVSSALGQQSPFLPADTYDKLTNEISGDIAFENLRSLVNNHVPTGEPHGFLDEAQWVEERAKSYGLEAKLIPLPAWRNSPGEPDQNWAVLGGELWLVEPKVIKLGDVRETRFSVADNSPSADITAELIDVGEGSEESDYTGKDIQGKVVLAYGAANRVKELACWARGAVGIVSYNSSRTGPWTDHPDQIAWSRLTVSKEGEKPAPPVFVISPREGLALSREISGRGPTHIFGDSRASSPPPFKVHLKIEAAVAKPGRQGLVEGVIRGTTLHDQAIVLTANLQEGYPFANDDRSGCANLLEIARALVTMMRDGRLPRPRRDIRFWWTSEINAQYEYFAEHPEESARIIADINQDMVGARQLLGGRGQQVSRAPFSRSSYLNDVVESIVTSLSEGNNAYIASWQNHNRAPYSRPIFAHLGSREPYRIAVVHYFADHLVFNDGAVGIPGVSFTNWPDEYIHSSDDDLWQIDPTQLQRNAVAVAASALYLANLSEQQVLTLAAVMTGEARKRISHDLAIGVSRLAEVASGNGGQFGEAGAGHSAATASEQMRSALDDAMNLLDQAELREVAGLETLRRFATPDMRKLLDSLEEDMKLTEVNHRQRIQEWYRALGGSNPPAATGLSGATEEERLAAAKVPKRAGTLGEYLKHSDAISGPQGLHPTLKFEALNYIDGKRSILDIYRAVRAESLSAGEWYCGAVSLADIDELFQTAEKDKAIEIRPKSGLAK
jgi:hypothetical protein